jgi:IS30 family transposase
MIHGGIKGVARMWNRTEKRKLEQMLKEGSTWNEISAAIGRSKGSIARYMDRMGMSYPERNSHSWPPGVEKTIRDLLSFGLSWAEIGRRIGKSGPNVSQYCARRGWKQNEARKEVKAAEYIARRSTIQVTTEEEKAAILNSPVKELMEKYGLSKSAVVKFRTKLRNQSPSK